MRSKETANGKGILSFKERLNRIFFEADPNPSSDSEMDTSYFESVSEGSSASDVAKQIIIDSQYESDNDELVDITNVQPAMDAIGMNASREQLRGVIEKLQGNNPDDMVKDGEKRISAIKAAIETQRKSAETLRYEITRSEEAIKAALKESDSKYFNDESKTYTDCETSIDAEKARAEEAVAAERDKSAQEIERLRTEYEAAVEAERERSALAIENERATSNANIEAIRESAANTRESLKAEHEEEITSLSQTLSENAAKLERAEAVAEATTNYGNVVIAETQRLIDAIK